MVKCQVVMDALERIEMAVRVDVAHLLVLLEIGDIEARSLWGRNPAALAGVLGDDARAFSAAMTGYDFEAAVRLLRAALNSRATAG